MKKSIKYWLIIIVVIAGAVLLLAGNKSKLDSQIYKEKNTVHSVVAEPVAISRINSQMVYAGITEAINDVELISETSGKVEKVFVENGSYTTSNSILFKIDDEILQANYKLAEASLEKAKLDFSRFEVLIKEGNLSTSDLENSRIALKNAEAQYILTKKYLSNTAIKSPISGMLINRYVNIGSTVAPGMPVANIVDISKIKIKISIPEKDITKIKTGEIAVVTSGLFPNKIMKAKIKSISVKADESHNYPVELLMDNDKNSLKAGMYVDVEIGFTTEQPVLTISRNSLTGSIKNPKVYVILNDKAFEKEIFLGGEIENRLIILKGLDAGDEVVTEGQNNLQDGANVIIKNKKLL